MGDFEVSINPNVVKTTSKSSITPEPAWAKLLDFETRLPRAVERLVNR
jgi:hypothetical protein